MVDIGISVKNNFFSGLKNSVRSIGTLVVGIFLIILGIFLAIVSKELKVLIVSGIGLLGVVYAIWSIQNGYRLMMKR